MGRAAGGGTVALAIDDVGAGYLSGGVHTPASHFEILKWGGSVKQGLVVGIVRHSLGECPVGKADSVISVAVNFRRGQKF